VLRREVGEEVDDDAALGLARALDHEVRAGAVGGVGLGAGLGQRHHRAEDEEARAEKAAGEKARVRHRRPPGP